MLVVYAGGPAVRRGEGLPDVRDASRGQYIFSFLTEAHSLCTGLCKDSDAPLDTHKHTHTHTDTFTHTNTQTVAVLSVPEPFC